MAREQYPFQASSRLYKQARELADKLRKASIAGSRHCFSRTADSLAAQGLGLLQTDEQWQSAIGWAKKDLDALACRIDPRLAIPALIEAVDDFYYGQKSWRKKVPWCGSSLKTTIALIWPNRKEPLAVDRSAAQLLNLVNAVIAWEQLREIYESSRVFNFQAVSLKSHGFAFSDKADQVLLGQWNTMAAPYGENQRTLEHSKAVIWKDLLRFSQAVSLVLSGRDSTTIELFAGTVFALAGKNPAFWIGLNARLVLLAWVRHIKSTGSKRTAGVVLFEDIPIINDAFGDDPVLAKQSLEACFWQEPWYPDRVRSYPSNMLVERPVVRIDDKTFATSVLTIIDSVNCFVEHSVFRYMGYGGAPVDDESFRVHVSQPFENAAVQLLRNAGWKASGVSDSGYWQAGESRLEHESGQKVPGEIDVLALHPSGRVALLIECKVLSQPFSMSKLSNVVGKLGPSDSEGFHAKIEKKVTWAEATSAMQGAQVVGLLLVEHGSFLGENAAHPVVEMRQLEKLVAEINETFSG